MENKALNLRLFKERLKDPSSHKLKDQFLHFLDSITENDSFNDKKLKIYNFTLMFEENLPKYPCWSCCKPSEIEEASEVVEYLVTKEKYSILFAVDRFCIEKDEILKKSYERLDFIQLSHLDISISIPEPSLINATSTQLQNLDKYTSPRNKLICLSNCFRIINKIILNSSNDFDDSLPLFVYILLKSQVERLYSNYLFIKAYRYKPRRQYRDPTEFQHTFTSFKSALNYIINLNTLKLQMSHEEFLQYIQGCKRHTKSTQTSTEDHSPTLKLNNPSDYTGDISASYLLNHPKDLERFLEAYKALLITKSPKQ